MNKFFGLFCVLSALMILSSLFIGKVFATSQFDDHFLNLFNWDILPTNSVDWIINDNSLVGSVGKNGNSYIFLKNFEFSNKFELTYDAKSVVGVDQELIFRVDRNNHTFYVINTRFYEPNWSQDGANEVILWRCFSFSENVCSLISKNEHLGFNLNKNQFYKFKLAVDDKHINFSIDGTVVMDHTFNDSYLGGVGFWNWGGQFGGGVSNIYKNFSIVSYDYVFPTPTSIQMNTPTLTPINTPTSPSTPTPTLTPTLTPTPTLIPTLTPTEVPSPTPTPTEIPQKKKIFILPGLGASWNSKAIVYGENVTNDQWKMTPFVNNYDGLIELLNINGLEKDKDYYVWNYDWRKNLSEIEKDFNNYVGSKNLSTNDEIYLIGHSLGGVVARLWAQDHSDNSNIKQVINLGSPNLGSLDVYSVWNGGKVMKSSGLSSTVFNIILGLQNKGFVITDLSKIRNFAPIAKDLLPTFDYAIKNKKTIGWRFMNSYNSFLDDENKKVSRIDGKLKLFVGTG